jgi:V8-like Glu-specific endopeptidase
VVLASVLLLQVSNPPQAKSVSRGNIEIGSKFVVSLVKNGEQWSACSGSLMSSDVVVTAAHCVYGANYIAKPFGLSVTLPGSVINSSARPKLFQVEKIIVAPTFGRLVKNPNQYSVDVDDIAFLFLVEPIPSFEAVQIADSRLVTRMKNEELDIKHYGYGLQKQTPATLDGNPYSVILKATNNPVSGKSPSANDERVIYSKGTIPGPAICSGDSGGPGYVREGEKIYLVSVMSGAGGCDSSTNLAHTFSTLIYPHLSLLQSEYQLFSLQKSAEKSALELKAKQEADAKAAAELKANQEADAKAAAELKAKQEADAKAAADKIIADAKVEAERILAAARAATTKKTTINCVKGKLTKKVTAVKPKCPSGYKVKK